ncbi:MAG: RnfABCDGE type electron transport complex subunit G [Bacteroidaceae bacterium]|jgi:electron transport complex protein RnfG|nr:RnfABCDGE type electron transport complex subunit G [Bacteroidaceae bacterium]
MEKLKSSLTNMLVVLTVIAIIAAGVLASVNAVTAPQIEKINAENLAAGIKAVMGSDDIQVSEPWEVDAFTAYDINDANGDALGKAVVTTENGFGGPLKVLVGFNTEGDILGYTVLEHAETPGLGAKAGEWFQDKIIGMNPGKNNFTVSKDGGEVDAITASTITSRAFLLAIQNAYDKMIAGQDVTSGATKQADKADACEGHNCKGEGHDCKGESHDCKGEGHDCKGEGHDCKGDHECEKVSACDIETPEVIE